MSAVSRKDLFYSDVLVRFSHCDPAGIIFYPQYFVMFNGLVEDWFNHGLGINYATYHTERRLGLPIVRLGCDFAIPSKIGEVITLTLGIERIGNSSLGLSIRAVRGAEERLAAQLVLVNTALDAMRAAPIPPDLRERFEAFRQGQLDIPRRQA